MTHVRYCSNAGYPHSVTPDELHTLFERATARFPNVELVQLTRVHNMQRLGDLGQVVRALPSLFSRLRAIQIETARMPSIPRDLEQLPLVELIR